MKSLAHELRHLRALKDEAEAAGTEKKEADKKFKQHMDVCMQRMEIDEAASFRTPGEGSYLFTHVDDRLKGQVEDRRPYVRWALENDPAIIDFLAEWDVTEEFEAAFFQAITSTSTVEYKEKTEIINQQARAHVDDGAPLPPGLTFRPDPYISMKKS